jgi:hypothetical protein
MRRVFLRFSDKVHYTTYNKVHYQR